MTASQKAAAKNTDVKVTFHGATYLVPNGDDWDIDVLEAIEQGKVAAALKALLGEKQYAKFRSGHSKVRDLNAFYEAIGKAAGTGNS